MAKHRCFIQPIDPEEDEPKIEKVPMSEVGSRAIVAIDEEDGKAWVEKPPPLSVYADHEAVTDAEGVQSPILVCAEPDDEDETYSFYGSTCTKDFMEYIDGLTEDEYGEERRVICIFHNFKGYDGMFILKHLYDTHREVENQVCISTKVLSLSTTDITFKDSLCFLPFPLSTFPATFGIEELCKGFFPHKFNTLENQDYVGPMPPAVAYDPEGMTPKTKKAFETWYADKVRSQYQFNLKQEMER